MVLAQALEQVLSKSQETIKYDIDTKRAELRANDEMLTGRQIMRMDLALITWKGDDKIEDFYRDYR
eukprot:5436324-Lingulodinium_polyedra.AAC.1